MRRPSRRVAFVTILIATGCSQRLYEGPSLSPEQVAVIQTGTTIVREIDGQRRRGGAFDVGEFEITPGRHHLALVFELTAHTIGMKNFPAQSGVGVCVLEFTADAGKQYYLGSRARGEPDRPRWDGSWEGWVRDPTLSGDDDVIARCASQPLEETAAPAVAAAPALSATLAAAPTQRAAMPLAVPTPPAAPGAQAPIAAAPAVAARAAAAPARPAPAAATIRLGEWNLRSLGRGSENDCARVAAAIDANFDILAVTEVLQIGGAHPGYDALLRALSPEWAGLITDAPRPNTATDGAEYYAILYRRARVRPCAGWEALRYVPDNDGSSSAGGPDRFLREPAFGCFDAGDASAPGVDFLLAVYRATSADGDAGNVAAEVAQLDDVFTAMKLARPGEDDLIIAGDFHLESVELPQTIRAADRTRAGGSLLNLNGDRTAQLPDHILVYDPRATAELLGEAEALDVRGVAPSNAQFYRTVSDHLPIMVRLRASGPDDD